jgi:hypothetical protein
VSAASIHRAVPLDLGLNHAVLQGAQQALAFCEGEAQVLKDKPLIPHD